MNGRSNIRYLVSFLAVAAVLLGQAAPYARAVAPLESAPGELPPQIHDFLQYGPEVPLPLNDPAPGLPVGSVVTLHFDDYPAGTRIAEQYAGQAAHFLNDYQPSQAYRSAPTIQTNAAAKSAPNVLVNEAQNIETSSSSGVPLMIWFDQPVSGVGLWLGTQSSFQQPCSDTYQAVVSSYDCNGSLLESTLVSVSLAFNSPVELDDPAGQIRRVMVDYGATTCPEAVDELAYSIAAGVCTEAKAPVVSITSHSKSSVVNLANQVIRGVVTEADLLKSIKINGTEVKSYFKENKFHYSGVVTLHEGSNTITVVAEDMNGKKGSAQVDIILNMPVSASLSQFHLTQRGAMKDIACDIDSPFVAGKSAILRANFDIRTASGGQTYASQVELRLYRKTSSGDTLVGTYMGEQYSSFLTMFNSPSQMTGIHFWLPGYDLDPEGEYKFVFQPYAGSAPIGPPLTASCGGEYISFQWTNPIRLLIVPAEYGHLSPVYNGTYHVKYFYRQLTKVIQSFPVRDEMSRFVNETAGLIYWETPPFKFCDGSATDPFYCKSTGWDWILNDHNPDGTLRTFKSTKTISDPGNTKICEGKNDYIGGQISDQTIVTFSYNPALGIMRNGAHMGWLGAKFTNFYDEDHDGDIDKDDWKYFIAEFYDNDSNPPGWSTDLSKFDLDETFRFFVDQDGDQCNDWTKEPQAPVRTLFEHFTSLLFKVQGDKLFSYNQNIPGTIHDYTNASLWFADLMVPPTAFRDFGPGRGDEPGTLTWTRATNVVAQAHELGHNYGLSDRYGDKIPDDMKSIEDDWLVYESGVAKPAQGVFDIMAESIDFDDEVFNHESYQKLFDKLVTSKNPGVEADASGLMFVISGQVMADGQVQSVATSLSSGMQPTPADALSPYQLVFGRGGSVLSTHAFALEKPAPPPEGYDSYPQTFNDFRAVVPFPILTTWIELRKNGETLWREERSAAAPQVHLLSPNGPASFGANQAVTILWQATDPDSSTLVSSVFYSNDAGQTWQLLANNLVATSYVWNTGDTPGAKASGLIKVVVTDGLNSGEDQSDAPFTVAGKAPQVVILEPTNGQTFMQCSTVHVNGLVEDPENQLAYLQWFVDDTESLTQPSGALGPLEPGDHTLKLWAADVDGQTGQDQITVHVTADSDCDGMSDAFEALHGFDSSDVQDAAWDLDEDGLRGFDEAYFGTDPRNADSDGDGYLDGEEVAKGSDPADPQDTPASVYISPAQNTMNVGENTTVELRVNDVKHLYGLQFELSFDPTVLQVVDAYPSIPGVQIEEGDFFVPDLWIQNSADNTAGTISYAASLQGAKPGLSGSGVLARITFHGLAPGVSQINFTQAILSDPYSIQIQAGVQGGALIVQQQTGAVTGKVTLERRASSAGASVCLDQTCAATNSGGGYLLPSLPLGSYTASASHPSYLRSWIPVTLNQGLLTLPDVTLLAGDINQDDSIELADLNLIGQAWNATPVSPNWNAAADITNDKLVNILDMVAVPYNWDKTAPGPWGAFGGLTAAPLSRTAGASPQDITTHVVVSPASVSAAGPGLEVGLDILVQNVTNLYSYRLQIAFNPAVLKVKDADTRPSAPGVQIQPGTFLDPTKQFVAVNTADNSAGTIDFAVTQLYPAAPKSGSGLLAHITFRTVGSGTSPVDIFQARLLDSSKPEPLELPALIQDGQVIVGTENKLYFPLVQNLTKK